ncbi:hypothetical protein [Methylorubrum thiocyanatum]|uniref:hypothetical protein n=1 Tax=Methylorubrum thiocyanatum TaxID=47958 RepID=UPI0035C7C063
MLERVEALEAGQKTILAKLDEIGKGIADGRLDNEKRFGAIEGRLTGIEAKLDARATKADLTPIETKLTKVQDAVDTRAATSDLNLLKGKVDALPTTTQLVLFAVAIFAAAGITRFFGH